MIEKPKKIMFWSFMLNPRRMQYEELDKAKKHIAIQLLKTGKIGSSYMGWAECRICGERLGTSDYHSYGYMWPEKAEHYIEKHNLWYTKLDQFLIDSVEVLLSSQK